MNIKLVGRRRLRRRGFTLLELQIAIVLLAFGVVTLASLMATQTRLLRRLQAGYGPGTTIYVTRSNDPWVQKLAAPARLTSAPITQSSVSTVTAANNVSIVSQESDLKAETVTVTADVTPIN
jgi:hypothetical protein